MGSLTAYRSIKNAGKSVPRWIQSNITTLIGCPMKHTMRSWMALWLPLLGLPGIAAEPGKPAAVTVFAAASLTSVLQELGDGFTKDTGVLVKYSFAASSTLAKQIENGAPADVFFSADVEWMDYLQTRKLIRIPTRHDVVGNKLVLVAPSLSKIALKIGPHFALAAALGKGHLATGDPDSVPVGRYAREALTQLGVWRDVEARLVRGDSVRSALAFVDRGEASLGIVYATDAKIDDMVRVVDVFPDGSHLPIVYPIAATAVAKPAASAFVDYVRGPVGEAAFKKYGFTPLHQQEQP
jgi:molybdate transport system substrate-binding protein